MQRLAVNFLLQLNILPLLQVKNEAVSISSSIRLKQLDSLKQ